MEDLTSKGFCAAYLYILVWDPCKDVFYLTIFHDSLYAARIIRVGGLLYETAVGRCRCLKIFFTAGLIFSGQKYDTSRIYFTCGPSPKSPISKYNRVSSTNGQAPSVSWYSSKFSSIVTFFTGILSVISSVLTLVCCWVTTIVPGFLNFPSMYFIRIDIVQYYSLICIFRICVAAGPLIASSISLVRLVRYSMLRESNLFFDTLLPGYDYWSPVVIFASLTLGVTCGNWRCRWVTHWQFNNVHHIKSLTTPIVLLNLSLPCILLTISPDLLFFFWFFNPLHA